MAGITTPPCSLFAASLIRPVQGFFMLSVTFDQNAVGSIREMLRITMVAEYGSVGRRAALPLADLNDGRWLLRFVSKQAPYVVNPQEQQVIVRPAAGSILCIEAQLQPLRSYVGIMPVMQRIVVHQFVPEPRMSNRGTEG